MLSNKALAVLFASAVSAAVLPVESHAVRQATATPATTAAPTTTSIHCDLAYCDGSTSWCHYWAGYTSYDLSLGPQPGEVRTSVGLCGAAPTTVPAANNAARDVTDVPDAPATTAAPTTTSLHCDLAYCDGSISWCHYWAGYTSYNLSLGPQPGEVRTSVGTCSPATATPATTTAA